MIFLRGINYTIFAVYLLMFILLLMVNCGGGGSSFSPAIPELEEEFRIEKVMPSISEEYFEWLSTFPEDIHEFPEWWNSQEAKNWNFTYWTSDFPYDSHEYDSGESIYFSKLINCHRGTVLLLQRYPGKYIYIDQEGDKDHAVFQGIDSEGPFYISFCSVECGLYRTIEEIYN